MSRLLELLLSWFRPRRQEPPQAPYSRDWDRPVAGSSMAALLEDLEQIGGVHPELYDTDVREQMWEVIDRVLIKQTGDIEVPEDLGMFSTEGNRKLRECLEQNLKNLKAVFEVFGLDTEARRLKSFFNPRLHTEGGTYVEDFFGHP